MTKSSKEQDVKHEEQESVGSPKFVVELTSDRASANAELSAVMQHLRQVEQRELCQGLSAQADGSDALGSSSSGTAGLREDVSSATLHPVSSPRLDSVGQWEEKSYLNCMLHVFSNMFDRWGASLVEKMEGLLGEIMCSPFFCNMSFLRHLMVCLP